MNTINKATRTSFRDPQGQTWVAPEGVIRVSWSDLDAPPRQPLDMLLQELQGEGKWIPARAVDPTALGLQLDPDSPVPTRAWEHPRVFFPSYAHEWSPTMLHRAAELTLELNERLLQIGWELKDATPTNILFQGPHPIFVDHLSPSPRQPGQMGWLAYGQFIRTFLIPLCLHRLNGLPLSWIHLARRDGVSPEDASRQLSLLQRMHPSVFGLITLPAWLSRRQSTAPSQGLRAWKDGDESIGRAITARLMRGLRQRLKHWVPPPPDATLWSQYDQAGESYSPAALLAKEAFIQQALESCRPTAVLDLGCNTGRYSLLAAASGAQVVAVDGDPVCIDQLWQQSQAKSLDILPLVMDLGRPSPALGWEYGEEVPFLERTEGRFDMVFALALVHHLLVRERVPLIRILTHLARQTTQRAIVEWVAPEDPQFERLAGPHRQLYEHLSAPGFEAAFTPFFKLHGAFPVPGVARTIYLLEKR